MSRPAAFSKQKSHGRRPIHPWLDFGFLLRAVVVYDGQTDGLLSDHHQPRKRMPIRFAITASSFHEVRALNHGSPGLSSPFSGPDSAKEFAPGGRNRGKVEPAGGRAVQRVRREFQRNEADR